MMEWHGMPCRDAMPKSKEFHSLFSSQIQNASETGDEVLEVDGLRNVQIEPCRKCFVGVSARGICSKRDRRNLVSRCAQTADECVTVLIRHRDVANDNVRVRADQLLPRGCGRVRAIDDRTSAIKK